MSHSTDTTENFSSAHEASAHKALMSLSAILAIVFISLAVMKVDSILGPYMWYAFSVATVAATAVFGLMLKVENERKGKGH
jgi:hypothetical protein